MADSEYRKELIEDSKLYARIDYEDDDKIIELIVEVALQELDDLISGFDQENLTPRQRLLVMVSVKELYDNREKYKDVKTMSKAASSMLLKEMYGGGKNDGTN